MIQSPPIVERPRREGPPPNVVPGSGNILDALADEHHAVVVPVNCVPGVMGAGLAKAAANAFPGLDEVHRRSCEDKMVAPGQCYWVWLTRGGGDPEGAVVLAGTKKHWRNPSKLEWVRGCLDEITLKLHWQRTLSTGIWTRTILCPALGCGLGGLRWAAVAPLVYEAAARLPEVRWKVWEPGSSR